MLHLKYECDNVRFCKNTKNLICGNKNAEKCPAGHPCKIGTDCIEER